MQHLLPGNKRSIRAADAQNAPASPSGFQPGGDVVSVRCTVAGRRRGDRRGHRVALQHASGPQTWGLCAQGHSVIQQLWPPCGGGVSICGRTEGRHTVPGCFREVPQHRTRGGAVPGRPRESAPSHGSLELNASSTCGSINIPEGCGLARLQTAGKAAEAGGASGPDLPTWAFEGPVCPLGPGWP